MHAKSYSFLRRFCFNVTDIEKKNGRLQHIFLAFLEKMNFTVDKRFYNPDNKCNCEKKSVQSHIL